MRLTIQSVSKSYQSNGSTVEALKNVSLEIGGGEFHALQGRSGCGKSTLLLAAGGLLRPDQGQITIEESDLYRLTPEARTQFRAEHVGFVFQQFHLVPYLSVLKNVLSASLGLANVSPASSRARALELIKRFGLEPRIGHRPSELSTGERQRTALARALLNHPKLLLADEPTGNLDEENSDIVLGHLSEFAQEGGSVLLATHDDRAAAAAHHTLRMAEGRLLAD